MVESEYSNATTKPDSGRAFSPKHGIKVAPVRAHIIFWPVFAGGLVLDLASKSVVFEYLADKGSVTIIDGFLCLVRIFNNGAAFNLFAGQGRLLIVASVVAFFAVVGFLVFGRAKPSIVYVALGLFAAGVCGNLYDRLSNNGSVRDFIDVVVWPGKHWPAFNLADSMLCVSVGLILIAVNFTGRPCRKRAQPRK